MQETRVWSLGWEDPLEEEMATHSSILAWRIPWTEEPGGLQSMGPKRVGQKWHPTPVLLPGESHGGRSLVGYSPWGRKESDTTEWLHFHFHFNERNQGQHIEKYFVFLDGKNQYRENEYTTKCNLQIQCDPYQITNGIFHRSRTKKLHNSYGNTKDPEQPNQSWKRRMELEESTFLTSGYTTKLQSLSQYGTCTKT